jgi:hypothetical protein
MDAEARDGLAAPVEEDLLLPRAIVNDRVLVTVQNRL